MREQATDPFLVRSRLDGRIAFVAATFALAYALVGLLDRVGAPERLVGLVAPYFTLLALALLGASLHSMRISRYFAAGRAVPAAYAGFAVAAIFMGLALPFLMRFSWPPSLGSVLTGLAIGLGYVALLLGPLLRKTGAFSLAGLLAARFPQSESRLGMAAVTAASSGIVALAGYQASVDALVGFTGTGRALAAFLIGAAVLMIAGPGGLSGVIWSASAAAGVAVAAFGLPAIALSIRGFPLPAPVFGDPQAWREAIAQLHAMQVLPDSAGHGMALMMTFAFALGALTLAPNLMPAVTTPDTAAARRAGFAAVAWTLALAAVVAATIGASSLAVSRAAIGRAPERLPDVLYAASSRGFVRICGVRVADPAEARQACLVRPVAAGAPLRGEDVTIRGEYLMSGLPELLDLGSAFSGLLASAAMAAGLILAAAGLHACAAAIGHEALYRMSGETALTSRRLAMTRLVLAGVTALGAAMSATSAIDAGTLVGLALTISAAGVAPVLGLAMWPRAGDRDAMAAQLVGVGVMAVLVAVSPGPPGVQTFAAAALAGCLLGAAAGVFSAWRWSAATAESRAFVHRLLFGDGRVLTPDKEA